MKKAAYILFFINFLNCLSGQPQIFDAPFYQFDIYTVKNGLSNNRINDIFQDKEGFMWIATARGLNRFDGYNFHNYINDPEDSTSLSGNIVSSIAEDIRANLYIGTENGLDMFDSEKKSFIHIFPFSKEKKLNNGDFVRAVILDTNGLLWFDTADGQLHRYVIKTGDHHSFQHEKPGQLYTYFYHSLYEDKKGNIWVGGRGMDPCRFDKSLEQFTYFKSSKEVSAEKKDSDVTAYYSDSHGVFWVAGIDGLYSFDQKKETFDKYLGGSTFDIIDFTDNELWFANGSGIKILNHQENRLHNIQYSAGNKNGLPSQYVFKLFKDRAGNMWIGTLEGICKYSPAKNKFQKAFQIYGDNRTISSNHITSVLEDNMGKIWLGTATNGIDIVNQNFINIEHLSYSSNSRIKLGANQVSKIYQDSKNNVFVGLWAGIGFNMINEEKNLNKLIRLDTKSRKLDWYNDFMEDSNGRFWVGSWSSFGLIEFDIDKRAFINNNDTTISYNKELSSHFVSCLLYDSTKLIWIGTSNRGLSLLDVETDKVQRFPGIRGDSTDIAGASVNCVFQDSHNNIWIAANGLNLYHRETNSFEIYTIKNGLSVNNIQAILEDDNGFLWLGTENGLSKFDIKNELFNNYYEKDGLSGAEFTGASAKLKDGRLVFGTKNGITIFRPENIKINKYKPSVTISGFKIFEEPQDINDLKEGELQLKYNRNYLSFEFSSSDYSDPENNSYSYKLENFDKNWQYTADYIHSAKYTYLEPGEYLFLLKVANADGIWNETSQKLRIIINPPFWKTWWFVLLEILVVGIGIYAFIRQRENKLREQHYMELMEQRLLRSQMNPHFIFNALSAIQSYIYSHNPIEAGTYLSKFADLMRSILYGSRKEYISLEKEIKTLENYLLIQQLRFEDKFDYNFDIADDIDTTFVKVPPMLVQPFIENSIEHGFRNLDRKGIINIIVKKENGKIKFVVEDNGVGLGKQVKSKTHQSLATQIVKERLKILNKEKNNELSLKISNIINKNGELEGTRVTFYLPLIN